MKGKKQNLAKLILKWRWWFLGTFIFLLTITIIFFLLGTDPNVGPWIYVLF